jgi:hypothetical protein
LLNDTDWLKFHIAQAVVLYLFGSALFSVLQLLLGIILIRDTLPNYHIPVFALGSIITDLTARFLLRQSLFNITPVALLVAGIASITSLFRVYAPAKRPSNAPKVVVFGIVAALALHLLIFGIYFLSQNHQPILTFIESAGTQFHAYSTSASSPSLKLAVEEYISRYSRPPPPGFDIWFQFATDRGSKVINEYDQIVDDLRPFWGVDPQVLRERVGRVAANEWNDVGMVSIRDKVATVALAPQWRVCVPFWEGVDGVVDA